MKGVERGWRRGVGLSVGEEVRKGKREKEKKDKQMIDRYFSKKGKDMLFLFELKV